MASTNFSDLEELLEQPERQLEAVEATNAAFRRAWRVAVLLGGVALVAGTVWSVRRGTVARRSGGVVDLEEIKCFEDGMYYADPIKLDGTERTVEFTADACQQRCQTVEDCAHFTFWPDGGCLLTGDISYPKAAPQKYAATISGPKFCGDVPDADADSADSADSEVVDADSGSSGLVALPAAPAVTVAPITLPTIAPAAVPADIDDPLPAPPKPPVLPGTNGTTCSSYPACVAAGITEGDCCPNTEQVKLGCCDGFPKQIEEVKVAAGTECSLFPACVALNITAGACCPTADGVQLGCCSSI